jgi:hypothetical protein
MRPGRRRQRASASLAIGIVQKVAAVRKQLALDDVVRVDRALLAALDDAVTDTAVH